MPQKPQNPQNLQESSTNLPLEGASASASENANANAPASSLGALLSTGVIAALAGFAASLLYFHFNPQVKDTPPPIAVIDMVKLSASITKMTGEGGSAEAALQTAGESIAKLKAAGYIILDARYVIGAPDQYVMESWDLVPGAPEMSWGSGYVRPMLQPVQVRPSETSLRKAPESSHAAGGAR